MRAAVIAAIALLALAGVGTARAGEPEAPAAGQPHRALDGAPPRP